VLQQVFVVLGKLLEILTNIPASLRDAASNASLSSHAS